MINSCSECNLKLHIITLKITIEASLYKHENLIGSGDVDGCGGKWRRKAAA